MIDVKSFLQEMLLESVEPNISNAIAYEHNLLRKIYGKLETKTLNAFDAIITLDPDTAKVLLVSHNHKLLHRVNEEILDATDFNWRQDSAAVPRSYVYRGEEPLQTIRLHPIPSLAGTLQIVKLAEPNPGVARWHDVFVALRALARLSEIDPLRARPEMSKVVNLLTEMLYGPFTKSDLRSARR